MRIGRGLGPAAIWPAIIVVGVWAYLLVIIWPKTAVGAPHPRLIIDDASVGADLRTLADETWQQFLGAFPAQNSCMGDVRLEADRQLGSRAAYAPKTATVTVRVPGTPAMLKSALVHEWAHHLEFQCAGQRSIRPAFLAAQNLPPDTPWRPDGASAVMPTGQWAAIPSEQFAEAAIELVLGHRPIPTKASYSRAALRVVQAWAIDP